MRPAFIPLLALLAPLFFATAAGAQPVQPLDRVLPEVHRTHPGQFYDADGPHPGAGGSQHYHLKWMTPDGRIVWYDTDARTGRVLGASPGRDNFDPAGEGRYGGRYREGYDGPPRDGGGRDYGARGYGRGYNGPAYGGRPYGGRGYGGQRGYGGNGHRGR